MVEWLNGFGGVGEILWDRLGKHEKCWDFVSLEATICQAIDFIAAAIF